MAVCKELKHLAALALPTREEEYQGRKHLVVPVVALVEGVVQAMNAASPEFVSAEEYTKFPESWNGRPVFVDHPMKNGKPVSGNAPDLLEKRSVGTVFNTTVTKGKLTMEAWIDVEKAEEIAPELLKRLESGDPIEISVGVFADTDDEIGVFNGKKYKGAWHNLVPDHLALLPEGHQGACSREMGCGVRAAELRALIIRKDGDKWVLYSHDGKKLGTHDTKAEAEAQEKAIKARMKGATVKKDRTFGAAFARIMSAFRGAQPADEMSGSDLLRKLNEALREVEPHLSYVETYYPVTEPNRVVYSCYHTDGSGYGGYELYERQFSLSDTGVVTLGGSRVEVEPVLSYEPVLMADAADEPLAAEGRRNNAKDQAKIQAMHDHAIALGAYCAPKAAESGKPCGCQETKALSQERDMNKEAIVKFLETATPAQLTALGETIEGTNPAVKAAQDAQATAEAAKIAAEAKAAADVKAATEAAAATVKAAQENTEYVAFQAAQAATKAATIKSLKDTGRCDLSDEQLASKTQAELDQLVKLAGTPKAAVDFSGQGGPKDTQEKKTVAAPPSLTDAIKANRAKQ